MKLLPYHRFEITSALTRADALAAIGSRIEERKWFRVTAMGAANDERFDGSVTANGFNVTRIMGYRNSFAPVIEGEVHEAGRFSRIVITMKPSIFVLIFASFFSLILLVAFASMSGVPILIAIVGLIFLYAMVSGGFWFEANKLEQTFRRIFQAT